MNFFCIIFGIVSFLTTQIISAQTPTSSAESIIAPLSIQTNPGATTTPASSAAAATAPAATTPTATNDPMTTAPVAPQNGTNDLQPNQISPTAQSTRFAEPQYSCKSYIELQRKPIVTQEPEAALSEKQIIINKKRIDLLKSKLEKDKNNTLVISRLGKEYFDQKKFSEASDHLWTHINLLTVKDLTLLAQIHEQAKQKMELQKVANLMIGQNPKNALGYLFLAKSYDEDDPIESIERKKNLMKTLELDNKNKEAILLITKMFRKELNWYADRNVLVDGLKNIKNDKDLMTLLCESYSIDSAHSDAEKTCAQAIKEYPDEVKNYVYLGITYRETYKTKQADEFFEKAVAKFPNSEFARACLAEEKLQRKDYVGAFNHYSAMYEQKIYTDRILMGYAKSAFQLKKYNEALVVFKIICQRDRSNAVEFRRSMLELGRTSYKKEWLEYETELNNCVNR